VGIVGTEQFHQLADANLESADNNVGVAAIADKFNWKTPFSLRSLRFLLVQAFST
jgi:hypothetical protein